MWFYENLEGIVGGIFATGFSLHFLARWRERLRYRELRRAYERSVQETRALDGDPAAVVREAELYRAFMHSWLPGWFEGFGRCLGRWLKVCAVFTLVAYFLKGPIIWGEQEYARNHASAVKKVPERPAAK